MYLLFQIIKDHCTYFYLSINLNINKNILDMRVVLYMYAHSDMSFISLLEYCV